MVRSRECVFMVGTHWTSAGKQARLESFTIHAVADETLEWAHDGMKECLELKKDKPFQWRRQAVGAQMQRMESMYDEQKDETFFAGKRNLLTAKWEEPFSTKVYGASMHLWDLFYGQWRCGMCQPYNCQ